MSASTTKYLYLRFFSNPKIERQLYAWIAKNKPSSIVEFGLGDATRAIRLIEVAQRCSKERISYCGIDMFEMSKDAGQLPLREAHKKLNKTGAHIRLLPGDPLSSLARSANAMQEVDLFVSTLSTAALSEAWFYVPRMLTAKSRFFLIDGTSMKHLNQAEVEHLARTARSQRKAA